MFYFRNLIKIFYNVCFLSNFLFILKNKFKSFLYLNKMMKMMKKLNVNLLLVGLLVLMVLFGCGCMLKKMTTEGFTSPEGNVPQGYDGKRIAFVLASWCGHCKSLKESGVVDEVVAAKDVKVEVNEDDEAANKKYNVSGFPTILLVKENGETLPFKGPRTAEKIIEFFKSN